MSGSLPSVSIQIPERSQSIPIPTCGNICSNSEPSHLQTQEDERDCEQDNANPSGNVNEDEDEDEEDADFNPFLKETLSAEVSSSLSSEVEGMDTDFSDGGKKRAPYLLNDSMEKYLGFGNDFNAAEEVNGDEIVMQEAAHSEETSGKQFGTTYDAVSQKKSVSISESDYGLLCGRKQRVAGKTVIGNVDSSKPVVDMDIEGAICMRTRARYSLASFTLDELEVFLQETDEEDDLHNVDDEEEYRKFLAVVLHGDDSENIQGTANVVDDDEDNDADFELELDEALESDPDEIEERRMSRRNRPQRSHSEQNNKVFGLVSKPLRPILPIAPIGSFSSFDGKHFLPNISPPCMPPVNNGFVGGFSPHQIGQLHSLIHEHVQLLIQVFSLSVLDPAKNHIAAEIKQLMMELLKKYNQVLTWKSHPYPRFCFFPPYIHPSVSNEFDKVSPMIGQSESNRVKPFDNDSLSNWRSEHLTKKQPNTSKYMECDLPQTMSCTPWLPSICGPIRTVMDVAPLRLVGNYVDDVSSAIHAIERYQIEPGFESHFEKEPLFPLHNSPCFVEIEGTRETRTTPQEFGGVHSSISSKVIPKKTMAAMLVEKAKMQSVALVPKEIAKLAQRFRPLFNPALYPHKPPPSSIANRVLFTDTEDELLALGLMEYNSDWKSIQLRFLPSKSKHQIFVRQKNRASSKAPENPIKAVRRMKNSPLTSEEIAGIELGLKKFKLDWISIWRFFVPYRDPSLLPRLWRIASGTQKSYKSDANKKAKRRLYELRKKATRFASTVQSSSDKEDNGATVVEEVTAGDNFMDSEDEAYVHEAFLENRRPDNPTYQLAHLGSSQSSQPNNASRSGQVQHEIPTCPATLRSSTSEIILRPYRARGPKSANMVKLAPGLPPVNLPPSVRVISQSVFKSSQAVISSKFLENSSIFGGNAAKSVVDCSEKSGNIMENSMKVAYSSQQSKQSDKCVEDSRVDTDLQMHPLLFQAPHDGFLPYYPLSCSTGTPSHLSFFSGNKTHLNVNPCHNFLKSSSSGVDFHPLLQRTDNLLASSVSEFPTSKLIDDAKSCKVKDKIPNPMCKPSVNDSVSTSGLKLSSSSGLDRESVQIRDMALISGTEESQRSKYTSKESCSTANESGYMLGSEYNALITPMDRGVNAADNTNDDSLPGIIMEQEELSDSDEEFGENVEFECEEMADSEEDNMSESEHFEFNEKSEEDGIREDTDGFKGLNAPDDCE